MNFNKCERCGCFFITDGNVCPSCAPKDVNELSKLNNYFTENKTQMTINELSSVIGISQKNILRLISNDKFDFKRQIKL